MIDPVDLWDFDDPAGSEQRFRAAADGAAGTREQAIHLTQLARALGLQGRYAEGRRLLDKLANPTRDPEVEIRTHLERGRLLRSEGRPDEALPEFLEAGRLAALAEEDHLHVDALHMVALVADPAERLAWTARALEVAAASADVRARNWDASLLNNLGMAHSDAGDLESALGAFESALTARRRIGEASRTRVARWMIAWTLRRLGRTDEALAIQRELKAELDAAGEVDPYVDEELALLSDGA